MQLGDSLYKFGLMRKALATSFLLLVISTITGCQTVPTEPLSVLSGKQEDGTGRVVIRPYYIPLGVNFIAIFMAGGTTPFNIELYDVTDQPKYLGDILSKGVRIPDNQRVIEYDVQPGVRVLMLRIKKTKGTEYLDFIEVPVASNQTEHVSISQYGMMDHPYFMKNELSQQASKYCGYTQGIRFSQAKEYFDTHGITTPKYTADYCVALSSKSRVQHVQPGVEWSASIPAERVTQLKNQYLEAWRKMASKTPPYDIK